MKIIKSYKLKILLCFYALVTVYILNQNCYGISDNFKFVIDTIGIPEFNILGDRINEEIYYAYNIFVYSDPIEIKKRTNLQRFKIVRDNGKWIEKETLERGEYYILGTNYSGNFVTNVYFPVDFIPEALPNSWIYINNKYALNSWKDSNKYKYIEQLEYMKNSNLWFDKIDYKNNTCNSYELVEYDINANSIGLEKVVLENCATWKTYGTVSVNRKTSDNKLRYATFFVKPMSASADIKSKLQVEDNVIINSLDESIDITFGANAINLSEYAKEEHIKEIVSKIYINNELIDTVKNMKSIDIKKKIKYKIPYESFNGNEKILNIKVKSYLYTEFSVDGLMQDTTERNITIHKDISKVEIVPANDIFVKLLEKDNDRYFVKDLIQTDVTESLDSLGIVEKGRNVAIKIDNISFTKEDSISVYINDIKLENELINENKNSIVLKFKIVNDVPNTIASWNDLRRMCDNYFNIDVNKIGTRLQNPNVVTIQIGNNIIRFFVDTIDYFIYNINYTFLDNINNLDSINCKKRLEEWIKI